MRVRFAKFVIAPAFALALFAVSGCNPPEAGSIDVSGDKGTVVQPKIEGSETTPPPSPDKAPLKDQIKDMKSRGKTAEE